MATMYIIVRKDVIRFKGNVFAHSMTNMGAIQLFETKEQAERMADLLCCKDKYEPVEVKVEAVDNQ